MSAFHLSNLYTSYSPVLLCIFSDYGPRTVVLQRAPEGYGFVLRGAKCKYLDKEYIMV